MSKIKIFTFFLSLLIISCKGYYLPNGTYRPKNPKFHILKLIFKRIHLLIALKFLFQPKGFLITTAALLKVI